MAKPLAVHVAEVTRHDGPILLPNKMSVTNAIEVLTRKAQYDAEPVQISDTIPVFPWDGALALQKALVELFGLALQSTTEIKSMFGGSSKLPAKMIEVEVGPGQTVSVPWGKFVLPGINGYVQTGTSWNDGRICFGLTAECTHADEPAIRKLFQRTREIATLNSIYDGKAITIKFRDASGNNLPIPEISFLKIRDTPPIFSKRIEQELEANVLVPIRYSGTVRTAGTPLKRGILLAGPYGTGKTLAAMQIARECQMHGWTFLYIKQANELAQALMFAQGFQPCVVFCEDVDRIAGIERSDDVNDLLNSLDGIDGKAVEVMTILTSNHAENINPAMRRPGRIDRVFHIAPPDAEAAERLIRHYGGNLIHASENLSAAGTAMSGQIPALIREMVESAKLSAIARERGKLTRITQDDLLLAADSLLTEKELFTPKPRSESIGDAFVHAVGQKISTQVCMAVDDLIENSR